MPPAIGPADHRSRSEEDPDDTLSCFNDGPVVNKGFYCGGVKEVDSAVTEWIHKLVRRALFE